MIINRRQLRTKVLQMLYAYEQTDDAKLSVFEKNLSGSIEKMYHLYLLYLLLLIEFKELAARKIEESKKKFRPSKDDLSPSYNFIENRLLVDLTDNVKLKNKMTKNGVSWSSEMDMVRAVFNKIRNSGLYQEYLAQENPGLDEDAAFLIKMFKDFVVNNEVLLSYFEEQSIYWIEDIDLVASMIVKSFKRAKKTEGHVELLDLFKDEKDEKKFYKQLFHQAVMRSDEIDEIIKIHTKNWEIERIALMDVLLMRLAVTEAIVFSSIPVKVTLNEYIELAKQYSTNKSNFFINGVLDKAFISLKAVGKIKKSGRGLLE